MPYTFIAKHHMLHLRPYLLHYEYLTLLSFRIFTLPDIFKFISKANTTVDLTNEKSMGNCTLLYVVKWYEKPYTNP